MPSRAVVITLDALHLGYLGCYGNDWIETPNLDRMAARGIVFDSHFVEQLEPGATQQAWWTGRYQSLGAPTASREQPSFLSLLETSGVRNTLFLEAHAGQDHLVAPPFEERIEVQGDDRLGAPEASAPFARLVQRVGEWLCDTTGDKKPRLLWIKSRGVPNPWLPPGEFGDLYLEEFGLAGEDAAEEEDDPEMDEPPSDDEPEEATPSPASAVSTTSSGASEKLIELKYARALYAAYVTWLDRWFGKLVQLLEQHPDWSESLLIVTAGAGESLGERGGLGESALQLREELVHTPLIVRTPDHLHDATRRAGLVQPVDLAPTLLEWFGAMHKSGLKSDSPGGNSLPAVSDEGDPQGRSLLPIVRNEVESIRRTVWLQSGQEWGLRTDAYFYVEEHPQEGDEEAHGWLFEKPDDRWDQADVAAQHPDVVDELRLELHRRRSTTAP